LGEILKLSDSVYPCETCGRTYNHDVLKQCPGCASQTESGTTQSKSSNSGDIAAERNSELAKLLGKSIEASNRTTFAVRAVVSLTAILLMTSAAVAILQIMVRLAQSGDLPTLADFLNFISVVVALVGIFIAYSTFFKEWRMSKVPGHN
jgi:hypothetical protein